METHHYPSDLTGEQWSLIEPQLPAAPPGGRPRKTNMRDVVDAILYILRTGCQWRYLPGDLPPKSTVWRYFDGWRRDGTLDTIHDRLRKKVRAAEKPYPRLRRLWPFLPQNDGLAPVFLGFFVVEIA